MTDFPQPQPRSKIPEIGSMYYYPNPFGTAFLRQWSGHNMDFQILNNGYLYLKQLDADTRTRWQQEQIQKNLIVDWIEELKAAEKNGYIIQEKSNGVWRNMGFFNIPNHADPNNYRKVVNHRVRIERALCCNDFHSYLEDDLNDLFPNLIENGDENFIVNHLTYSKSLASVIVQFYVVPLKSEYSIRIDMVDDENDIIWVFNDIVLVSGDNV